MLPISTEAVTVSVARRVTGHSGAVHVGCPCAPHVFVSGPPASSVPVAVAWQDTGHPPREDRCVCRGRAVRAATCLMATGPPAAHRRACLCGPLAYTPSPAASPGARWCTPPKPRPHPAMPPAKSSHTATHHHHHQHRNGAAAAALSGVDRTQSHGGEAPGHYLQVAAAVVLTTTAPPSRTRAPGAPLWCSARQGQPSAAACQRALGLAVCSGPTPPTPKTASGYSEI